MNKGLVGLLTVLSATIAGDSKGFVVPRWEPPPVKCISNSFREYEKIKDVSSLSFRFEPKIRRGEIDRKYCYTNQGGSIEYELQAGLEDTFDSILIRINQNLQLSSFKPISPEDLAQSNYSLLRCCENKSAQQCGGYCVEEGDKINYVLSWGSVF